VFEMWVYRQRFLATGHIRKKRQAFPGSNILKPHTLVDNLDRKKQGDAINVNSKI
jgi:hypothetical protein